MSLCHSLCHHSCNIIELVTDGPGAGFRQLKVNMKGKSRLDIELIFAETDVDGSGCIDAGELGTMLRRASQQQCDFPIRQPRCCVSAAVPLGCSEA